MKGTGPFSVFPRIKHAHRTAGFFKIRGVNLGHQDLEDFMFRHLEIGDFRAEAVNEGGNDILRLSIEVRRGTDASGMASRAAFGNQGKVRARAAGGGAGNRNAREGIRGQRQGRALRGPPLERVEVLGHPLSCRGVGQRAEAGAEVVAACAPACRCRGWRRSPPGATRSTSGSTAPSSRCRAPPPRAAAACP